MTIIKSRSDLAKVPGFASLPVDPKGIPMPWSNRYRCPYHINFSGVGHIWKQQCGHTGSVPCPTCGNETKPRSTLWTGPSETWAFALWEATSTEGEIEDVAAQMTILAAFARSLPISLDDNGNPLSSSDLLFRIQNAALIAIGERAGRGAS